MEFLNISLLIVVLITLAIILFFQFISLKFIFKSHTKLYNFMARAFDSINEQLAAQENQVAGLQQTIENESRQKTLLIQRNIELTTGLQAEVARLNALVEQYQNENTDNPTPQEIQAVSDRISALTQSIITTQASAAAIISDSEAGEDTEAGGEDEDGEGEDTDVPDSNDGDTTTEPNLADEDTSDETETETGEDTDENDETPVQA